MADVCVITQYRSRSPFQNLMGSSLAFWLYFHLVRRQWREFRDKSGVSELGSGSVARGLRQDYLWDLVAGRVGGAENSHRKTTSVGL